MTRPALLACALLAASLLACGDPRAPIEPGEENPGGATTNTLLFGRNAFIRPATNLSDAHEQTFHAGNSLFNSPWVEAPASTTRRDGLGPHFNARSCAACHLRDGRGAPPEGDEPFLGLLIRLHVPGPDGTVLPDPTYGGQIQPFALPALPAEATPRVTYTERPGRYADGEPYTRLEPTYTLDNLAHGPLDPTTRLSPRVAPAVIGLGLLEAIPPARLLALADPDDADGDGISGRIQTVWHIEAGTLAIGRFGWRAEQPTVRQQAAAALAGDIGITSPLFPAENCAPPQTDCRAQPSGAEANETEIKPADLDQLVLYSQTLAVPMRRDFAHPQVLRGKALFTTAGCAACHVPSHTTGPHEIAELSGQRIWPYTDLLLHDLGDGLADRGLDLGSAHPKPDQKPDPEAREWRTPPLWGIGHLAAVNGHTRLLHDGRARGVAEAILWHGGEAQSAREAFRTLTAPERAALIRFVESL